MKTITECKGLAIGRFWIPPFALNEGELIGLVLYSGSHFYDLSMELVELLTGRKMHPALIAHQPLRFVEYFRESGLRDKLWPTTVKEYINTRGSKGNKIAEKIYDNEYIEPSTKVQQLAGTPRKHLSLYTTLSHTNKLVFDLVGVDPMGAMTIMEIVKEYISGNGAAILLDNFEDLEAQRRCTKYIKIEIRTYAKGLN